MFDGVAGPKPGSTENCSVYGAVEFVPGRSPFLASQKLTRSPDWTPTRSLRSEWACRKTRCYRAGCPCRRAPPTKHRARPWRPRIPPTQGGNAPLRLRLAAQPPSGLRCPHRTARAEARLCSATAALPRSGKDRSGERLAPAGAVSEANRAAGPALRPEIGRSYVFYRRTGDNKRSDCRLPHEKQLSPPQAALDSAAPCRGGFANGFHPKGSPARGAGGVSRLRGAAPGSANILPGHRKPSRPCGITGPRGAALTQNRSVTPLPSPAGVNARPTI